MASRTRRWLFALALAVLFLGAHLPFLASTPDDIDAVNFVLGVRDFDLASHRPHPPGYPVFIALGKLSSALVHFLPVAQLPHVAVSEAAALAFWGALFAALAVFPLLQFFRCVELNDRRALAATVLAVTCPLFWFTASRPLSDVPGLAVALMAQALLATAFRRQREDDAARVVGAGRLILLGALVAALAIGLRSQVAWLTLPLLAMVLLDRVGRDAAGAILGSSVAFAAGMLAWAVPLIVACGGPAAYLAVLAAQAREDFAGVEMLATHPTPRVLAFVLVHTFVEPWVSPAAAAIVIGFGLVGAAALLLRARAGLLLLLVASGPYALLHLAFHETVTIRYALPLVPVSAYLAVRGLDAVVPRAMPVVVAAFAATSLAIATPALATFARTASPVFRALADVRARVHGDRQPVLAMHHPVALALRGEALPIRSLLAPPKREWLEVVTYWRDGGRAPVWFLADPKRTDLALIDPASRRLVQSYRWPVGAEPFMRGTRPGELDWYEIPPPGWFLAEGWSLTPEAAGVSQQFGRGPGREPIDAFVRRRDEAAVLMMGGRHLGTWDDPDARIEVTLDDRVLDAWTIRREPRFFLRMWTLPQGAGAGAGEYARLRIAAGAADGRSRPPHVAIEQFDLQPVTSVVFGFDAGWHELEYNPATGRLWRWTSETAMVRIHHAGRDVHVRFLGDSPLRYFSIAPNVVVRAGSEVLARLAPSSFPDFTADVRVPADVLERAGGLLTIDTDLTFVPDERTGNGDRRRLGLRVWDLAVR